jgi:hypothetical protein
MTSYVGDGSQYIRYLDIVSPGLSPERILAAALEDWAAIDVHVHIEVGPDGDDHLSRELREAVSRSICLRSTRLPPTTGSVASWRSSSQWTPR